LKSKPKILFLSRWYPDRYDPMMGLFVKRHAELAAGFADVAVLYLSAAEGKSSGFQFEQTLENGVNTLIVYYGTKSSLPVFMAKIATGIRFAIAFCKGYRILLSSWGKPGIIHVNILTRLGAFALCLRWYSGIRYVITEHWSRYLPVSGTYNGLIRKAITKFVVRNAEAISTVSLDLFKAMQSHGLDNKRFMVLPNVVDTEAFKPVPIQTTSDKKRFIHISCFEDRSKNISGFLRTLSKLSFMRDDFECIMVGEGIDFERMKALAARLGLKEPQLTFTGLLENESLITAYQSAGFMVLFSNYETMSVVVVESLACGLPVIATSVGGIPEYFTFDCGRLVAAGDEEGLLKSIDFMLDHYTGFDKNLIRKKAVDTFGKKAVAEKLQQLYGFVTADK
jgi:glycosyltransferase involved in cell wall biosynthesis